ncbi:hypothetical protein [Kitasatospora sp. MAA4]|uniref:hypothetical protein n=1 Tax=Kitasatospora sp. MAA4 TaxID=3035093 RepID=UPI002475CD14|nr:hypothetical protein [Kitasatospora sp. MAA4]
MSSGYCIGAGHVLTAGHAVGPGAVSVRFGGSQEVPARVLVHGGEQVDLAILALDGPGAPEAPEVRIAHVDTGQATRLDCQGVGYPWWKEDENASGGPRPRGRAQLVGFVPTAEGTAGGRLTLHVEAAPRDDANGQADSIWSSISGTVVFAGDRSGGELAIGVVVAHRRRDGASALTLEPLSAIERLEPEKREAFRSLLGVGRDVRIPLLSGTSYPEPVPPQRQVSVRRILAGVLAAVLIVAGALVWSSHQDSVADGLTGGSGINATLTGTGRPGDPNSWWVLKDPQPAPAADTTIAVLAAAHEGAPMAEQTIRFTLQGNRHSGVMLTDIGARVIDRQAPLAGTAYMAEPGGNAPALRVGLDLDEDQPRARTYSGDDSRTLGGFYFDANGFSLAYRETTPVTVTAFAQRSLVRFVLVVSYTVDGKLQHTELTDTGGKPFAVSGIADHLAGAYTLPVGPAGTAWVTAGTTRADFNSLAVRLNP